MNPSLWFLVLLSVRARYLRIARGLTTLKGTVLMLLGLGFFALIVISPLLTGKLAQREMGQISAGAADPLQRFGPAGLLAFTLLSLFASTKHRGMYFSPAEVDFLFPGPFRRRELIAYRLAVQLVHTLLSVLLTSALLFIYLRGFWQTAAGLFLAFTFINLVQVAGSLIAATMEERMIARGRNFIAGLLVLFALLVFGLTSAAVQGGPEFRQSLRDILGSQALGWVLLPLKTFSETITAPDWGGFLAWGAAAAALDAALFVLILKLDVEFTESSIETSRKIHERLLRFRGGGRIVASSRKLRLPLPLLGRMGGLGPVAWRQAQEMVRETPGAAYLLVALGVGALFPMFLFSDRGTMPLVEMARSMMGIIFMLPFILSNWFRFDFRGDLDRMDILLSLPLRPWVVAIGQIFTPALVLSAIQAAGLCLVLVVLGDDGDAWLVRWFLLLCLPLNVLFIAIENLFFLIYPVRIGPTAPGDFQALGRILLAFGLKIVGLLAVAGLGALVVLGVYEVTGSRTLGGISGGAFLVLADAGLIYLVGSAFAHFDVSRATPE